MANTLVFPDGVSLATREEIPGPSAVREEIWERVRNANIAPGFVTKVANDPAFQFYAEANVDATVVWSVFRDLVEALVGSRGILLFAHKDDETPAALGEGNVSDLLSALEPHVYQLQHDGYVQFGIVQQSDAQIDEVFVSVTKHFKIWFNDEVAFRDVMSKHNLVAADKLEFIDEYPRVTRALPAEKVVRNADHLAELLVAALRGASPS
ncbi:hypothetical protein [Vitreimonas sp.]|uniref:hypothetical protein n=1 Tax=Vitreimonas sp. TaxID=3069702 RepID=UPI002EDB9AA5